MKMIWAIIRPECIQRIVGALDHAGISAMTRMHVPGPAGSQSPLPLTRMGSQREILMIAVPDHEVAKAVTAIRTHARPKGPEGHDREGDGNGRIFITHIDESFTIRTAGSVGRAS